jgi:hypothetical protein
MNDLAGPLAAREHRSNDQRSQGSRYHRTGLGIPSLKGRYLESAKAEKMFLGLCGHQEDLPAIRAAGLGAGGKPLTSTIPPVKGLNTCWPSLPLTHNATGGELCEEVEGEGDGTISKVSSGGVLHRHRRR